MTNKTVAVSAYALSYCQDAYFVYWCQHRMHIISYWGILDHTVNLGFLDYIWFGFAYYGPPRKASTWTNILPFIVIYKGFINKLVALLIIFVSLKVGVDAWFTTVSWYVKYNKCNNMLNVFQWTGISHWWIIICTCFVFNTYSSFVCLLWLILLSLLV